MSEAKFRFGDWVYTKRHGNARFIVYGSHGLAALLTDNAVVAWEPFSNIAPAHPKSTTPTPPPNTVPVRIAVAVGDNGDWSAAGWRNETDDNVIDGATGGVAGAKDMRISWITAHVPLPEQPREIEGSVEHG